MYKKVNRSRPKFGWCSFCKIRNWSKNRCFFHETSVNKFQASFRYPRDLGSQLWSLLIPHSWFYCWAFWKSIEIRPRAMLDHQYLIYEETWWNYKKRGRRGRRSLKWDSWFWREHSTHGKLRNCNGGWRRTVLINSKSRHGNNRQLRTWRNDIRRIRWKTKKVSLELKYSLGNIFNRKSRRRQLSFSGLAAEYLIATLLICFTKRSRRNQLQKLSK